MPELPELEIVCEVLNRRVVGRTIENVTVAPKGGPIILRNLLEQAIEKVVMGESISAVMRRGKSLRIDLEPSKTHIVINPKLMGRLQLCAPGAKKAGPVHVTFHLSDPSEELRYVDRKRMGQIYITKDLSLIPRFTDLGPDALEITRDDFHTQLRPFRGEIKGVLTRGAFVAGIGNAYVDEILWEAKIHPFRKRPSLSQEEIDQLFDAMRKVLTDAIEKVRTRMGDDIHLKPRDFFAVHMRGDEQCPRCCTRISSITANQRITNFCRSCQPGGLFKGM
jgi:formamidopyrimidine-DNA glycosylase